MEVNPGRPQPIGHSFFGRRGNFSVVQPSQRVLQPELYGSRAKPSRRNITKSKEELTGLNQRPAGFGLGFKIKVI